MLYSYALRFDDGAAPNPYGGVCTLALCKPKIRRAAKVGDWIVALGPTRAPDGRDLSRHVVCAMKVAAKLTFAEYDEWCKAELPTKLPLWSVDAPFERIVGDCVYYYGDGSVMQRKGVHGAKDIKRDLGGEFVLLSEEFYYLGDNAAPLPLALHGIRHPWVGHRSKKNEPFERHVISWIRQGCGAGWGMGKVNGTPLHRALVEKAVRLQDTEPVCAPCSPRPTLQSRPCARPIC